MTVKETLIAARTLLADIEHWCQGEYARDNTGCACAPYEAFAHSFCAWGAITKEAESLIACDSAVEALRDAVLALGGKAGIAGWNDGEEYELAHKRVLAAYDLAISRA